jgi:hypothetical protein
MEDKFRGKDKETGEWRYGSLVSIPGGPDLKPLKRIIEFTFDATLSLKGIEYEVIPESVGMWIGLKDKNGVDVYQGNIYNIDRYTDKYLLKWHDKTASFYLHGIHGGEHKRADMLAVSVLLGNLTDNPSLLKG